MTPRSRPPSSMRFKLLYSVPREAAVCLNGAGITDDLTEQHPMTTAQKARKFRRKYKDYRKLMKET